MTWARYRGQVLSVWRNMFQIVAFHNFGCEKCAQSILRLLVLPALFSLGNVEITSMRPSYLAVTCSAFGRDPGNSGKIGFFSEMTSGTCIRSQHCACGGTPSACARSCRPSTLNWRVRVMAMLSWLGLEHSSFWDGAGHPHHWCMCSNFHVHFHPKLVQLFFFGVRG